MRNFVRAVSIVGALTAIVATPPLLAQTSQRVAFARGNDNASVKGTVTGNQYRDYLLGAKAGQKLSVSITSKGAMFNILPPGSTGEAIYNGAMNGADATNIKLPKTGDYRIRVYLMGNAKDAKRTVSYQLSMTVM
ncbi:hypothetical protein WBP06_07785 [Novosphingobium sp. BL-8H]|uniref:hypothetical protein n=1 Tax=Novosphingobium sp. BL-8H TaxID=3127640 RepID=UPI003758471E